MGGGCLDAHHPRSEILDQERSPAICTEVVKEISRISVLPYSKMTKKQMENTDTSSDFLDDEAPESVSLNSGKESFLQQQHSTKTAQRNMGAKGEVAKAARRQQDALFKSQAEERKRKMELAMAEISAASERISKKVRLEGIEVAPSKKIFIDEKTSLPEPEVLLCKDKKVVVLRQKTVVKANIEAASKLRRQKEELMLLKNQHLREKARDLMAKRTKKSRKGFLSKIKKVVA